MYILFLDGIRKKKTEVNDQVFKLSHIPWPGMLLNGGFSLRTQHKNRF